MGKIAKIIDDFLDNYDDVTAQFESGTIKAENMKNRINAITKQTEKEIIELITDIACYTINAMKIADEQFDIVSDFKDKFLENLAKLKED